MSTLKPKTYIKRLADKKVADSLALFGAVSIEGPKWCGKTWTALAHANSIISFDDEDSRRKAELDINFAFTDQPPELIDEWNRVPAVWDAVRHQVDLSGQKGRFILTCSTKLPTEEQRSKVFHSGAGRIDRITMRPMSLYESGESSGVASLSAMLEGTQKNAKIPKASIQDIAYYIVRGGWPANLPTPAEKAGHIPASYIQALLGEDIHQGKNRSRTKMEKLLKSLARNESSIVSNQTLIRDIDEYTDDQDSQLSRNTLEDYLDILSRLHIIEEQPAFSINYRSSDRVGRSVKRRFVDPSLPAAILGLDPEKLLSDLHTFGFMFESLVERDLTIYMDALGGKVFHFRDNLSGDEVDAILEFPGGDYAAVEIKLGENSLDEASTNLQKFASKAAKAPKFMCVIVGNGDFVYRLENGIYVVPITALKN